MKYKVKQKGMILPFVLVLVFMMSLTILTCYTLQNHYLSGQYGQSESMRNYVGGKKS